MVPPSPILEASTRLDLEEFQSQFAAAWSRLTSRFLKVECWQEYQELDVTESQKAYQHGDIATAQKLLAEEAEADRQLYEDVRDRGIDYARIRLVKLPLTDYLKYELMAYSVRSRMGENIEVVRIPTSTPAPSKDHFDFLLFDRHTALIHDYGSAVVGVQTGGWVSHDADAISALAARASTLRARAVPLREFLKEARI